MEAVLRAEGIRCTQFQIGGCFHFYLVAFDPNPGPRFPVWTVDVPYSVYETWTGCGFAKKKGVTILPEHVEIARPHTDATLRPFLRRVPDAPWKEIKDDMAAIVSAFERAIGISKKRTTREAP